MSILGQAELEQQCWQTLWCWSRAEKCVSWTIVQALQPNEGEVEEMRGHVVIAGFGRVGQIIGQLLSERLIPFVALDVRSDRVQVSDSSFVLAIASSYPWLLQLLMTVSTLHYKRCCSRCVFEHAYIASHLQPSSDTVCSVMLHYKTCHLCDKLIDCWLECA